MNQEDSVYKRNFFFNPTEIERDYKAWYSQSSWGKKHNIHNQLYRWQGPTALCMRTYALGLSMENIVAGSIWQRAY